MDRVLEGDLSRFEVPDILSFLHMGRRTGVLVLEKPEQETKLFLREGNPIYASSSKDDLRFGALLVRAGRVTDERLNQIISRQRAEGLKIGEALLADKIVSKEELPSFLKVQVSEVIFDTFEWKTGTFTFYDRVPPPAAVVTLEMDLQNLVMEGVRRIDERSRVVEAFDDRSLIAEATTNPERVKHSVTFTPEEWQTFFLVDGRRSVDEICRLVGNPNEQSTLQALSRLVKAKFVTLVTPAPAPPEEEEKADASPAHGTQLLVAGRAPAPAPYSVEFTAAPPRRQEDDTKEIVNPLAVAYQQGAARLTVSRLLLVRDGVETSFPLTRDTYTLGRHRNNDIVISDPKVSSFHARIDRATDGFTIVDLQSRNGSFLNGQRIETANLKTGDEIRLGPARLVYKVDFTSPVA